MTDGTPQDIWLKARDTLRSEMNEEEFQTWIMPLKCIGLVEDRLHFSVGSNFAKSWFQHNAKHQQMLLDAMAGHGIHARELHFEVPVSVQERILLTSDRPSKTTTKATATVESKPKLDKSAFTVHRKRPSAFDYPVTGEDPAREPPLLELPQAATFSAETLDDRYTFEGFVVGPNNNMAHAAALRVAESPGRSYNPLFLYGNVGLGKTHLCHAIGHSVRKRFPKAKVGYFSMETFSNHMISSLANGTMVDFREFYRNMDLIIVEDMQFLVGKERIQEEFFHTFNALYDGRKQIVLSSDRPPQDLHALEPRLTSRFEWGLLVDLQAPALETRMAILKMKAEQFRFNVPLSSIELIAQRPTKNVRELEGLLISIMAYSRANDISMEPDVIKRYLSTSGGASSRKTSASEIMHLTAEAFETSIDQLKSSGRARKIVVPRQVAMYLIRETTDLSLPEIGQLFGRDHSTVIHAVQKIEVDMDKDSNFREKVFSIRSRLE